jgi:hypothetical protein
MSQRFNPSRGHEHHQSRSRDRSWTGELPSERLPARGQNWDRQSPIPRGGPSRGHPRGTLQPHDDPNRPPPGSIVKVMITSIKSNHGVFATMQLPDGSSISGLIHLSEVQTVNDAYCQAPKNCVHAEKISRGLCKVCVCSRCLCHLSFCV